MTALAERSDLTDTGFLAILERQAAALGLQVREPTTGRTVLIGPDGRDIEPWREDYPYARLLRRRPYEIARQSLQIELLKLQQAVKASGRRLLIVFEGRDAAGKGGAIRRFTENLNPRGTRVVALDKPAAHEQGDNYLCRFLPHLPGPGEIVLLDRSWYNRAGVEHVLGFCQPEDYDRFLRDTPDFERMLVDDGIDLIKLWFSVTRAEQLRRFIDRQLDPVKRWKLSPVDLASLDKWDDYSRAEAVMFGHTHLPFAPWTLVKSNDKRRARLETKRHVLSLFGYSGKRDEVVGATDPLIVGFPGPAGAHLATSMTWFLALLPRHRNHPDGMRCALAPGGQHGVMETKTQSDTRRSSQAGRAAHNGEHHDRGREQDGAGIDLPVVGHVPYKSAGFIAALGVAGAVGVIEWPVVAAVGIGYALSRRDRE